MDPDTEIVKPKEDFLKELEESIVKDDDEKIAKERLHYVKNTLVERFKDSQAKGKERRMSISSVTSQDSVKRKASADLVSDKESVIPV